MSGNPSLRLPPATDACGEGYANRKHGDNIFRSVMQEIIFIKNENKFHIFCLLNCIPLVTVG